MVTLRDVAERVGVHPSTVSRALDPAAARRVNEATRLRIEHVAAEMGFQADAVARALRRGRTGTIGIVVPDLGNPYAAPALRGIAAGLDDRGYLPIITETQDEGHRLRPVLDTLVARRVDAIISLASRHGDSGPLLATAARVPIVLAIRDLPGSGLPAVISDDHHGGGLAAAHLIAHGHRQVVQVRGPAAVEGFHRRAVGFRERAQQLGVHQWEPPAEAVLPTIDEGRRLMRIVLDGARPGPTAVFAHNDLLALGAISEVRAAGLDCPADISVIGYNDTPLTPYTDPPLTTIALAAGDLGRLAAEIALALIDDPETPVARISRAPSLVVRGSVADRRAVPRVSSPAN